MLLCVALRDGQVAAGISPYPLARLCALRSLGTSSNLLQAAMWVGLVLICVTGQRVWTLGWEKKLGSNSRSYASHLGSIGQGQLPHL